MLVVVVVVMVMYGTTIRIANRLVFDVCEGVEIKVFCEKNAPAPVHPFEHFSLSSLVVRLTGYT